MPKHVIMSNAKFTFKKAKNYKTIEWQIDQSDLNVVNRLTSEIMSREERRLITAYIKFICIHSIDNTVMSDHGIWRSYIHNPIPLPGILMALPKNVQSIAVSEISKS